MCPTFKVVRTLVRVFYTKVKNRVLIEVINEDKPKVNLENHEKNNSGLLFNGGVESRFKGK